MSSTKITVQIARKIAAEKVATLPCSQGSLSIRDAGSHPDEHRFEIRRTFRYAGETEMDAPHVETAGYIIVSGDGSSRVSWSV